MALQIEYEDDLRSADPVMRLHAHVKDLLANGYDRERAVADLEGLYARLQDADRQDEADIVADVLDCLTGFCSPGLAL